MLNPHGFPGICEDPGRQKLSFQHADVTFESFRNFTSPDIIIAFLIVQMVWWRGVLWGKSLEINIEEVFKMRK